MFIAPTPDRRVPDCKVCPNVDDWGFLPGQAWFDDECVAAYQARSVNDHDRFCEDHLFVRVDVVTEWWSEEDVDGSIHVLRSYPWTSEAILFQSSGNNFTVSRLGWDGPEATQVVGSACLVDY